ncbi:MAG: sensor histidine kinase [Bryobacteraceae bacterium]
MTEQYVLIPHRYRRLHGAGRIALAVGWFTLTVADSPRWTGWIAPSGFLLYAVLMILSRAAQRPAHALLLLALDAVFFLSASTATGDRGFWLLAAFHLHLMITAVVFHHWPQAVVVCGAATAYFVLLQPPNWERLLPILLALDSLALVSTLLKDALERGLYSATSQAVQSRAEADATRDRERERIASDFHDGPLQSFMSLQVRLEVVRKMLDRDAKKGFEELKQLQELMRSEVADLRAFVRGLRPAETAPAPIPATLSRFLKAFEADTGIDVTFAAGGAIEGPEPATAPEVLQIVQEALHNVRKHSAASRVSVSLDKDGDRLLIDIGDNGKGFPFSGAYSLQELDLLRLGPLSIRRRVAALKGDLTLESRPGHGSSLKIRIPA